MVQKSNKKKLVITICSLLLLGSQAEASFGSYIGEEVFGSLGEPVLDEEVSTCKTNDDCSDPGKPKCALV